MKHILGAITVIFCCGIFIESLVNIPFWLVYFLGIASLVLSLSKRLNILIFVAVFLLGAALYKNAQSLPSRYISKFISYKSQDPYLIKGVIITEPQSKNKSTTFVFAVRQIQIKGLNRACCGNILVYLRAEKSLRYGDELILEGNLARPFRKTFRAYLARQGIDYIMRVKNEAYVLRTNKNRGFAVKRFALWLKRRIENLFSRYLSPVASSVLEAMVLGDKRNIPQPVYNSMVKTGTVHILVVSGFNVGIVCFMMLLFLKLIRIPRKARFLLAALGLLLYCLITGGSNPVVRSTIMGIIFILAYLFKREPDIYSSLSVAALVILALNPRQLFDIGFRLSFVSVISIVYLFPKIRIFLRVEELNSKLLKFPIEASLVSLSAWIGTMGFIAFYFRIFSPITVIANIFVVPTATLITLCGFSLAFIGALFPPAALFSALSCESLVLLLIKLNTLLIGLPGAYFYLPQPN